ncbi:MAG: serine/threonine-protein kinase [Pirellulales bacterium]
MPTPTDRRAQVRSLVAEILATGCSVEAACSEHLDLIDDVRLKLNQVQRLDERLQTLFPPSTVQTDSMGNCSNLGPTEIPQIDGYELESVLGRGGVGIVYKALHLKLNRHVALKMLLSGAFASPSERKRFTREIKAEAQLQHPHIVQVYDVGEVGGRPYFTMEFLEGGTLAQKLGGVPQSASDAAKTVAMLAEAVHTAHRKGIVHRDLKPTNVLLTDDGQPKISDFGLAHQLNAETQLTFHGDRIGTPSYMAPEQALGQIDQIGPASDVYALGAILYELLTGRPPFRANSAMETERQVISEEPVSPKRSTRKFLVLWKPFA